MGTPATSESRSLDRLKTLDGIGTLWSQLDEARKLCNHRSRAEMILRWLLGKLKTCNVARQDENSWGLLASCIRLLSAQRLSALLGSGSLLEIVGTATTEAALSIGTICGVADSWRLLFDRGQATGGAAILSVLSTRSANAAAVFANWIRHLTQHCEGNAAFAKKINERSLLDLGLQIWDLRKRQPSDHELFNSKCLLPASMLLRFLSVGVGDVLSSRKRKQRGEHFNPENSYIHALEASIARHTILPARAAFFDRDQKRPQRSQRKDTVERSVDLEDTLNSVGQVMIRDPSVTVIELLPLLFDIAIRAVPTPTPRHRIQERPWLEKMFLTLRSLLENGKESDRTFVIAEMIRHIRALRVSLPPKLVSQLANETLQMSSMEGSDSGNNLALDLLAELIALDTGVFANRLLSERVFSSIATAKTSGDIEFYKTKICLPIMRAFAQSRDVNTFMELWHEILKRAARSVDGRSLWAGLVPEFADILCDSRSTDQILGDLDRYSQGLSMITFLDREVLNELCSDAVILDGILQGLRSDDLLDRAWQRLDVLVHKVFAITTIEDDAAPSFYVDLWQLLASLFESWFPAMVQTTRDSATAAEAGAEVMGSELFNVALRQCKELSVSTKSAQHLVAGICAQFGHYKEHQELLTLCKKSAAAVCKQPTTCLSVLAKYPDVLTLLDGATIVSVLEATSKTSSENLCLMSLLPSESLDTFLESKISSLQTMADKAARSKSTIDHVSGSEKVVVDLLSSIPLAILTKKQRVNILDTLSNLPPVLPEKTNRLERRFAAILALLQFPSEGSQLLANPSIVWSLSQDFKITEPIWVTEHDEFCAFNALTLLCKIAEAIINLWLRSQAQNRDKLLEISSLAQQHLMNCLEQHQEVSRSMTAMLAGYIIGGLETAGDDFLQDFAHRDPQVANTFSQMVQGISEPHVGLFVVEALLKISRSSLGGGPALASTEVIANVLKKTGSDDPTLVSTTLLAIAARAAQLFCRYAEVDGISMFQAIESILKRDLSGQDHDVVLKAFEARLQSEGPSFRFSIIEECLEDGSSHSAQALELQRCTITALSIEDFECPRQLAMFKILHHVLRQASTGETIHKRQLSLQTLKHILKDKSFMVNRFGVEQIITILHSMLIEATESASTIYLDICQILAILLTQALGRLQGRYHLLIALFQQLITRLFSSPDSIPRHSTTLSRLLQTFCSPPHIPRKRNASNLIDESRKAKAYAGQFVQYILHHYCSQILSNPPSDDTIREALVPGLWAMIEAIETNHLENGVKSLSAAMNNSERAVLRSVYEEWQRSGKWEGT
ncbi:hypothetical protein AC579_8710 [Pseudocercospora musae]|uniref:Nucleolar 27S pre-rRNA processing Urb2/Npa2 C-terminal domain-containing protein n=1 Tax=Pseudocercospora musae TaxID=113226 RepID=A0A139IWJ5_9PEZI|nr:hypothetical protein AC579_8710 [Pseudocercospora musae]